MGKAKFGIVLEDGVVVAGCHMRGFLFVDAEKQISGTHMKLIFSGQEKTSIRRNQQHGGRTQGNPMSQYTYGSRSLIHVEFPLDSSDMLKGNRIAPGHYKVPFDLELPDALPTSMNMSADFGYYSITYELKAELKGSGMLWNYKCERGVNVRAKSLDTEPVPFHQAPTTERVNWMCCLNRGSVSFGASVTDTRIGRGQSTRVSMSCRNQTQTELKGVQAILTEHTRCMAGRHTKRSATRVLAQVNFSRFAGMMSPAGRQQRKNDGPSEQDLADIFREIHEKKHTSEITIPSAATCSFQGSIIQVSHVLEIIVQTGSCVSNPTIRIPIQIGEPGDASPSPAMTTPVVVPSAPVAESAVLPSHFTMDSTNVDATIYVPSSYITMGGPAQEHVSEDDIPVVAVPVDAAAPTFENLRQAMSESIADYDLVQSRACGDPAWKEVLAGLSTTQYAALLRQVHSDFEETRVAVVLAQQLGKNFTCDYVVSALRVVAEWNRSTLIERLLPSCVDLSVNGKKIQQELSDWERMVTQVAFENALKACD